MKFADEETRKNAAQTIANMEFLLKREEFVAYQERMRRMSDHLAEDILHNDTLTPVEREAKRNQRLGILECLKAPGDDIISCQNVIRSVDRNT